MAAGRAFAVRGAVKHGANAAWTTDPVVVDANAASPAELGTLALKRVLVAAFATYWNCGGQVVAVGMVGDSLRLLLDQESFELRPVASAAGTGFEVVGDPGTTFQSEREYATLVLRGRPYPRCVPTTNPHELPQ